MLCLERGRHRIEELPHMVGGVRRMKQPVRHETAPIGRNGLGNLSGVHSMRYTFSSCAFTTIDFRGFDSSTLTDLFHTFSECSHLTTIYADATWALPSSGITDSQCFYSCSTSLVGGNGTVWASNKTAYSCLRIDTAGAQGVHDGGLMPGNKFDYFCRNRLGLFFQDGPYRVSCGHSRHDRHKDACNSLLCILDSNTLVVLTYGQL